ncbi:MAG: hypothetical protein WCO45_19390 [Pseudanabaena sp. ELA607]|jgi:hypothetical protein
MAISTLGFHQSNFDTLKMIEQVGLQHLVICRYRGGKIPSFAQKTSKEGEIYIARI